MVVHRAPVVITMFTLVLGCGDGDPTREPPQPPERPAPLAPLPEPASVRTDRFADSIRCAQCHQALDDDLEAVRDAAGRDVSPVSLWRPSMMALAARDPFYLAAWNEERSRHTSRATEIDAACARCHAPMAAIETENSLSFEDLVAGDSDSAKLGRDGVSCALCHQILPENLGRPASLSGGFEIGFGRAIFGPHEMPNPDPMEFFLQLTPTYAPHILDSELCATCHTVIVEPLDAFGEKRGFELLEQGTYFEWQNSIYADDNSAEALTCADCHLPTTDADDVSIRAPIATNPSDLLSREPFGRHLFVGGNSYMSRLFDANQDWAGLSFDNGELASAAAASEEHLSTAALVTIESASRNAGVAEVAVKVENRTGHKLPTGYPTRRLWLRFVATNGAGQVVFESGTPDAKGSLPGDDVVGVRAHRDRVTTAAEVVVWEATLVDENGEPTHRPLGAVAYGKDTRLTPLGFDGFHPEYERTKPIGLDGDSNFTAGSDTVVFEFPATEALTINVELLYQSFPAHVAEAHEQWPTPAGVRFVEMVRVLPPVPTAIAQATGPLL